MFADARSLDDRFRSDAPAFEIRVEPRSFAEPSRRVRRPLPWARLSLLSGAIVAGLSWAAAQRLPAEPPPPLPSLADAMPPERAPAPLQAPPPAWTEVTGTLSPYALDVPAFYGLPVAVEARRHRSGGREDGLAIGSPGEDEPHLRLTVSRLSRAVTGAPASLFVEVARRAAELELAVARVGRPAPLLTRFGAFEAAHLELEAGRPRACLAFRFQHEEADLRFFGWFCGSQASPATGETLACLFDRLALTPAADDSALRVLFAQADRRRVCGPAPVQEAKPQEPKPQETKPPDAKPERRRRG